ncbi:MAG: decaprenyl-phosphate phosphoribosyltransferase [Bacteroidota bacterium]|jgi:4-hydroxybenzoate polyprenyltransferase|nr:decaprenyl-phosphate phosphoribosyltransferase [Bacteroidota bacterium]
MNTAASTLRALLPLLIRTMRIRQWTKNVFVLSPLLFSRHLFDTTSLLRSIEAFFLFSLVASAVYVLNDIVDAEVDRSHPVKRHRPIASGALPVPVAVFAVAVIMLLAIGVAVYVHPGFAAILAAYFGLNFVYSHFLKRMVIIDVMTIAASFVLRIVAGAVVIDVPISEWLLICTSLLALFLGFSKRRHEITVLVEDAHVHRPVLLEYSTYFLDQMISLVTASTLICYILYTVDAETVSKFGSKALLYTTPFVLYGLFRYYYLVHQKQTGGDPTSEFLADAPLLVNVFLWAASVILILYFR